MDVSSALAQALLQVELAPFYGSRLVLLEYRVPEISAKDKTVNCEHYYEY